jgi:hypothetical protein
MRKTNCPGVSAPLPKYRAVSRFAFSRAACAGIAPEAVISAAYPATCRGSHSSNSARVIGRRVSSASLMAQIKRRPAPATAGRTVIRAQ